jgi:hypothetical protein
MHPCIHVPMLPLHWSGIKIEIEFEFEFKIHNSQFTIHIWQFTFDNWVWYIELDRWRNRNVLNFVYIFSSNSDDHTYQTFEISDWLFFKLRVSFHFISFLFISFLFFWFQFSSVQLSSVHLISLYFIAFYFISSDCVHELIIESEMKIAKMRKLEKWM